MLQAAPQQIKLSKNRYNIYVEKTHVLQIFYICLLFFSQPPSPCIAALQLFAVSAVQIMQANHKNATLQICRRWCCYQCGLFMPAASNEWCYKKRNEKKDELEKRERQEKKEWAAFQSHVLNHCDSPVYTIYTARVSCSSRIPWLNRPLTLHAASSLD